VLKSVHGFLKPDVCLKAVVKVEEELPPRWAEKKRKIRQKEEQGKREQRANPGRKKGERTIGTNQKGIARIEKINSSPSSKRDRRLKSKKERDNCYIAGGT